MIKFTPLTEKTFEFCCASQDLGNEMSIVFCPSTKQFGISLCASILKKNLRNDLDAEYEIFDKGDVVKVVIPPHTGENVNKITVQAKVKAVRNAILELAFEDKNNTTSHENLNWFLQHATVEDSSSKNLSSYARFQKAIEVLKQSPKNKWSNFLEVDFPVSISRLKSQVYYVSGRNKVFETKEFLEDGNYSETLLLDKNLIIKESLKMFSDHFLSNAEINERNETFVKYFNLCFKDFSADEGVMDLFSDIQAWLSKGSFNTPIFKSILDVFSGKLKENGYREYQSLKNIVKEVDFIEEKGVNLNNVKALVIDDIELAQSYHNTIIKLVENNIQVVVVADYANYTKNRRDSITSFKRGFPNAYVLNWDKQKLEKVIELGGAEDAMDYRTFEYCVHYFDQKITIDSTKDSTCKIDQFFVDFEVRNILNRVDGYDRLKSQYNLNLRPVLYWIKNSPVDIVLEENVLLKEKINEFSLYFESIKLRFGVSYPDIKERIVDFVQMFESDMIVNSKKHKTLPSNSKIFVQEFDELGGEKLRLLNYNEFNEDSDTVVFTGTPMDERRFNYLRRAMFEDFFNVHYIGFCKEAANVYNRFLGDTFTFNHSFTDKLPEGYNKFWKDVNPKEEITYNSADCEQGEENQTSEDNQDFDSYQRNIEFYRYSTNATASPKSVDGNPGTEKIRILELIGMKKIYLPEKGGKKLFVQRGVGNFFSADWYDIAEGDRIFSYKITRQDNIKMRETEKVDVSVFDDMDFWFFELKKMFESKKNFPELSRYLKDVKSEINEESANPEVYNLRNWLREDRLSH